MDNLIGKTLDGLYTVRELIGTGGMAVVYRAWDKLNRRTVAIKVLRPEYEQDEEFVRRFSREAEAAAKMVAERPTLPPNSKRATLVQPLSACTRHPEVIVFTGTPEQMMWLSMSMSYFDGHRHDFHASGFNAQCVEATLLPLMNDEPNISFGCYGGRASSDIGEDMMYMGVPANRLDTIVEGCRELAKRAIPQSRMKIYVPPIM